MASSNAINRGVNVLTTQYDRIIADSSGKPIREPLATWRQNIVEATSITTNVNAATLPNPIGLNLYASNAIQGDTDMLDSRTGLAYTVPTGRRLAINAQNAYHTGSVAVTARTLVKIGGTSYVFENICLSLAASTGQTGTSLTFLEAGEGLAMRATQAGLNVWLRGIEYDADDYAPKRASVYALCNGHTLLYTCPAGKRCYHMSNVRPSNSSGGARSMYCCLVPTGGSPGLANQACASTSVADGAMSSLAQVIAMNAGDSVHVHSDSDTAGQSAFLYVLELPA